MKKENKLFCKYCGMDGMKYSGEIKETKEKIYDCIYCGKAQKEKC